MNKQQSVQKSIAIQMSSSTVMANPSLSSPATVYHHHSLNRRHFCPLPSQSISILSNNFRLVSLCCQTPNIAALSDSSSSSSPSPSSAIDFLTLCHRLKTTKRKGWINHDIKGPESIADHMYRMALMGLIASDLDGVDRERCIKMAIVHDIAEAIVGDITPSDGIPKAEKSRREQAALKEMCEVLGDGMRADEIKELWFEYENNSSLEANLVKDFDKVEMILQALEYENEHGMVLDEFFLSTAGKFQTELGKSWAAEVISRRKSTLADKGN